MPIDDTEENNLPEKLVTYGIITNAQLEQARAMANGAGESVVETLVKLGFIPNGDIYQTIADTLGLPYVDLENYIVDKSVLKTMRGETAQKWNAFPLFLIENTLAVAMSDPTDVAAIEAIKEETGYDIEPYLASADDLSRVIRDNYFLTSDHISDALKDVDKTTYLYEDLSEDALIKGTEQAPVAKIFNLIIAQAVRDGASDIHIEPEKERLRIRSRIDGILAERPAPPKYLAAPLISYIKILCSMKISEARRPQDGRFQTIIDGREIDARVSVIPTVYGESVAIRLLDPSNLVRGLEALGFQLHTLETMKKILRKPWGVILLTGPTGSGKTTTLYAMLNAVKSVAKKIITIEDPVEYKLQDIRQMQVNPKIGVTFAVGLRSILRQDPDIIMVGEVRDTETARIAIQSALTGHLVFSTLHTNDAASAITRLLDMDIEPYLVASAVTAVVAQRLVRLICPKCKTESQIDTAWLQNQGLCTTSSNVAYLGKGCSYCKKTGYKGRTAIAEVLLLNDEIQKMIMLKTPSSDIKDKAQQNGMKSLEDDGIQKVLDGITSLHEVLRATELDQENISLMEASNV